MLISMSSCHKKKKVYDDFRRATAEGRAVRGLLSVVGNGETAAGRRWPGLLRGTGGVIGAVPRPLWSLPALA